MEVMIVLIIGAIVAWLVYSARRPGNRGDCAGSDGGDCGGGDGGGGGGD
jgi:hypothetical protein